MRQCDAPKGTAERRWILSSTIASVSGIASDALRAPISLCLLSCGEASLPSVTRFLHPSMPERLRLPA